MNVTLAPSNLVAGGAVLALFPGKICICTVRMTPKTQVLGVSTNTENYMMP